MKIKEYDGVRLKDGREGTVVGIYEQGTVFMIEICDRYGQALDTSFVKEKDIVEITYHTK